MTTAQKVIKYLAFAFAIFLTVSIIGGMVGAASLASYSHGRRSGERKTYSVTETVESLEIDLSGAELFIETGERFSVESDHKYLTVENKDGLLKLREEHPAFGFHSKGLQVILTVPEDVVFDKAVLSTGAGTVKVDALCAETLSLDLGAGEVSIDRLCANTRAKINGGIGELTIRGGELANLDFDMGVGEVNLESRLSGDCDIDYGVGELNLTLTGTPEDYRITLDKGLGEATLDGRKMHDEETYGSGENAIEIEGGVGELCIRFAP